MCGFLVQFSPNAQDFKSFENANDMLDSRGPDSTKYIENVENYKFGFKRLSILDLGPLADQPMIDHENKFVIVFNGEIYNFDGLRNEILQSEEDFLLAIVIRKLY